MWTVPWWLWKEYAYLGQNLLNIIQKAATSIKLATTRKQKKSITYSYVTVTRTIAAEQRQSMLT